MAGGSLHFKTKICVRSGPEEGFVRVPYPDPKNSKVTTSIEVHCSEVWCVYLTFTSAL